MTEQTTTETKEVTTEITTVAAEEKKQATPPKRMSIEEYALQQSALLIAGRKELPALFGNLSKKASIRVLSALFEAPMEGLKVQLKTKEEKMTFGMLQAMLNAKVMLQNYATHTIMQEEKARQAAKNNVESSNQTLEGVKTNE